jgi:hypothetical protein
VGRTRHRDAQLMRRLFSGACATVVVALLAGAATASGWAGGNPGGPLPAACWARSTPGGGRALQLTTSSFSPSAHKRSPQALVDRVLSRLGDRRYIRSAGVGPVPPVTRMHNGYFGRSRPPKSALWLYMSAPDAAQRPAAGRPPTASKVATIAQARWETNLVAGAVRDELCLHGTRPLAGWTLANQGISGVSDESYAFAQRFPNPSSSWLLNQLHQVGSRWGFSVVSVRYLHPLQEAPIVILRTDRPPVFAGNNRVILNALHIAPGVQPGWPYEGYYIEVQDRRRTPFLIWSTVLRGTDTGSFYCAPRVPTCPKPDLLLRPRKKG